MKNFGIKKYIYGQTCASLIIQITDKVYSKHMLKFSRL